MGVATAVTVMLIAGPRLHPIWASPLVPLMFLVSCLAMGYAAVVIESSLAARFFRRPRHTKMLTSLFGAATVTIGACVACEA